MAWARAEDEVRSFIERTQLPFLASPMGKAVSDDHPLSVGAARSHALREADVIFLMGPPELDHARAQACFNENVRIIQLDSSAETIGTNVPTEVALVGDGKSVMGQMNRALDDSQWFYPADTEWRASIAASAAKNAESIAPMAEDD